jgi:D-glycero-alpha-D-manno-heptose-7-phosphate kinase
MGSSSSFTVGLLHALYALKGKMPNKRQLSQESIYIEQEILRETVGSQDQVSASYGGFNIIEFSAENEISVRPMTLKRERIEELNAYLMLFYTGIVRTASNIADSYVDNIEKKSCQLRAINDFMRRSVDILNDDEDMVGFGRLMHEAWQAKRSLSSKVSNSMVDDIYGRAMSVGAIGGKLTGAGGGGFMLLFVPLEKQKKVREALSNLIYVPFKFEFSGSQIVFFSQQDDYSVLEKERRRQCIQPFFQIAGREEFEYWRNKGGGK